MLQGPFATFKLAQDKDCDWTGMKFSPDGKMILISTNGQVVRLIDAFQGTPLQTFMVSHMYIFGSSQPMKIKLLYIVSEMSHILVTWYVD